MYEEELEGEVVGDVEEEAGTLVAAEAVLSGWKISTCQEIPSGVSIRWDFILAIVLNAVEYFRV